MRAEAVRGNRVNSERSVWHTYCFSFYTHTQHEPIRKKKKKSEPLFMIPADPVKLRNKVKDDGWTDRVTNQINVKSHV